MKVIGLISDYSKDNESKENKRPFYRIRENYVERLEEHIDEQTIIVMLPYLNDKNLFIRYDIASVLYNSYPEQCMKVLKEISKMTISTGLPKHLVIISLSAQGNLEYGVPKDYP